MNARFMADRRMRIRRARRRLGRIFAAVAVHVIKLFRLGVVGLHVIVSNGPCRREAAVMADFTKIFFAQTEQRRAVEFGIAADVIVGVRMKFVAVFVMPHLFGLIFTFEVDGTGIPVVFLARHIPAPFQEQDALAGGREFMRQSAAACAGER